MFNFELSSKKSKNGKKFFKAVLHEIYPDECVVNEAGTLYNSNGITYLEKYTKRQLGSIENMSVTVEFVNDERTEIYGHGMTDEEDGMGVFRNATMIGNFTKGYVDDMEIDGEVKRVCVGEGYLDYMRYKDFIDILQTRLESGERIEGSVEFSPPEGKDEIQYLYGFKNKGRIPVDYDYTGYAVLGIRPADKSAVVTEINESKNKEGFKIMDEKILRVFVEDIKNTLIETNSKNEEHNASIVQLNNVISEKDAKIDELNAKCKEAEEALAQKESEINKMKESAKDLEKELNKYKKEKAVSELNFALKQYTDKEKSYAKDEIDAFNEDYTKVEVNAIINKINAGIGAEAKKTQTELNAANNQTGDIFGYIDEVSQGNDCIDFDDIF